MRERNGCVGPSYGRAGRPFEAYTDQPDTAERKRREMQAIPFGLPERAAEVIDLDSVRRSKNPQPIKTGNK